MIGSIEKYNKIILMEEFSDIPFFIQQQDAMRKQLMILECLLQSLQKEKPNEHNMVTIVNTEDYINAIHYAKTMQIYNLKKRIEKYSKTGDPEIVRILNAICKGEFYIVYENEHYKNEEYIVNYEEMKENNKMIIKKHKSKISKN